MKEAAAEIMLIPPSEISSSVPAVNPSPSIEYFVIRMQSSTMDSTTGNPKTAINTPLFPAREEIADISVNEEPNPDDPRNKHNKNIPVSAMGLPIRVIKVSQPAMLSAEVSKIA